MRISILLISILALFIGFTSCEDDDETTKTTNDTTTEITTTKASLSINVFDINQTPQPNIKIGLFEEEIVLLQPTKLIKTVISNSEGIAFFDLQDIATEIETTYYLGALKEVQGGNEILGTRKVEGIQKRKEITTSFFIGVFDLEK